jgi:DNA-binding SARP family transcriptional activator
MSNMVETVICLMGGFRILRGSGVVPIRPSAERLVARLALKGAQTRYDVSQCLWPESCKTAGLSALRTVLTRARVDAPHLIVEDGRILRLAANNCDASDVRQWAIDVLAGEEPELYPRGLGEDLLPGWDDSWLAEEREELRGLQLHALDALCQRLLLSGMLSRAARAAMAAVRIDPMRESATRLLIEVHLRQGNELEALKRFRRYERLLRVEMGLIPGPALRTLIAPTLAARADRPEGSSRQLGRQTTLHASG